MIPDYVIDVLSEAMTGAIASRDAQLRPTQIRVFGARVHPDQKTVTCYVAERHFEKIVTNLEDNGRIAYTIACPTDNDSYQLKGKFISWRNNTEEDEQFLDSYQESVRDVYFEIGRGMGMAEEVMAKFNMMVYKPGVAVTFEVDSVFGQAPHPETGKLIS